MFLMFVQLINHKSVNVVVSLSSQIPSGKRVSLRKREAVSLCHLSWFENTTGEYTFLMRISLISSLSAKKGVHFGYDSRRYGRCKNSETRRGWSCLHLERWAYCCYL